MKLLLTLKIILSIAIHTSAETSKIYKSVNKQGQTIYTSQPPHAKAQPAKLPEIVKKKDTPQQKLLDTCVNHGGNNCQAGPDSDGSVICLDGYRSASARFNFSCSTAKLEVINIQDNNLKQLLVTVRNSLSIPAKEPYLYLRRKNKPQQKFTGPSEVPGYGVEDFLLNIDFDTKDEPIKTTNFKVSCRNCN